MSNLPVLCYWDIRGLAQPIRLLLEYTGTKFEDRLLACGPAPAFDKSCWLNQKGNLGLDFPNLPYYVDGDVKLTQSNAILRFIARKHNLLGANEAEAIRVDLIAEQAMDLRNSFTMLCYNANFEHLVSDYVSSLPSKLESFSRFLGDRPWFAGDNVTFVDFVMYELVDVHRVLAADVVAKNKVLVDFATRFEALPAIAAYIKSDRFMKAPLNNKSAKFGNSP